MRSGCSLVILAGGLSRRMGRDKAALPAGDGTLIEHLARRLAPVVDEIIIAGGSAEPRLDGVRLAADRDAGLGPLAGMHAGLMAARHPYAFVVGCDLPDVDRKSTRELQSRLHLVCRLLLEKKKKKQKTIHIQNKKKNNNNNQTNTNKKT